MTIPYPVGNPLRGKTAKDTEYLKTLQARTTDQKHPRNQGVVMQAHHVISAKGIAMGSYNDRLEDFGYRINEAMNLVFIPSTLQGACLLQVQPHRGNHTAQDAPDVDGNRDRTYHESVKEHLKTVMPKLEKLCGKPGKNMQKETQDALDAISEVIIECIQHKPSEAKLTKLYKHFQPGNVRGCGGAKGSVNDPAADICPVHRNHTGKRAPGQPDEKIVFKCVKPYELIAGN